MRSLAASVLAAVLIGLAAAPVSPAAAASPDFALEQVASGYQRLTGVAASAVANRLYVVEQEGVVRVLKRASVDAPWQKSGAFLDIRNRVRGPFPEHGIYESGLLGLAFHPDYVNNGRFYVAYSREPDNALVVVEYRRNTNLRARPGSARLLMVIKHSGEFHFGGWLGFGPDGYLYVTSGDAATWQSDTAQDTQSPLGKVLRLNALAAKGSAAQAAADNPFADGVGGNRFVWAWGLRNPWRAEFDSATGDMWLPDVGEDSAEELNVFRDYSTGTGANLGWEVCEGSHAYPATDPLEPCAIVGSTLPVLEYSHTDGNCAIVGGHVYRGALQAALSGRYFFADFCSGRIWGIPTAYAGGAIAEPLDSELSISSFGRDGVGELYVTATDGTLWHVIQS